MLQIKKLNIEVGGKTILQDAEFYTDTGFLTVIKGKSGIGKSTFLKTFVFENTACFKFNQIDLSSLSEDDKKSFIYNHIEFVNQVPQFMNGMKIIEHIIQFEKLGYSRNKDIEQDLGIKCIEKKFPSRLSGGEKIRTAIYFALMKSPDILILDEPTAALDNVYTPKIVHLIKEYSKDHIVIIASHDPSVIRYADILYEISDYKLACQKGELIDKSECACRSDTNILKKSSNAKKMSVCFGYKWFRRIMLCLIGLTFIILIYSLHIFQIFHSDYLDHLNNLKSLEILVYREKYENDYLSHQGMEYPLSEYEMDKFSQINHVDYTRMFVSGEMNNMGFDEYQAGANAANLLSFELFNDNSLIKKAEIKENVRYHSYDEETNHDQKLKYKFQDDGIIISYSLYEQLMASSQNHSIENPELCFDMFIPAYNATGIAEIQDNNGEFVACNAVVNTIQRVKMPIKGVLKENQNLYYLDIGNHDIFIPNTVYADYIQRNYPSSQKELFYIEGIETPFYNDIPEKYSQKNIIQEVTLSPWKPNSIIVKVDNISNYNRVIDDLKNMGVQVSNSYLNLKSIQLLIQNNQNILFAFFVSIVVTTYLFYIYIKYLMSKEERGVCEYLNMLGMNRKEINYIINKNHFWNLIFLSLCSSALLMIIITLAVKYQIISIIIPPKFEYFVFIISMSFLLEILLPVLIRKLTMILQKKY